MTSKEDMTSSNFEAIRSVLSRLRDIGVASDALSAQGEVLYISARPGLAVPKEGRSWSWRTTVNRSLLPVSVSPENRRHLLYAVLQDLIRSDLLLDENTGSVSPLAELDSQLSAFDNVFRVPAELRSDRVVLFPIHIAVPTVFATYERKPAQKHQTDKGFRGRFLDFFSSDETGFFDSHLHRVLRNLFAQTEGLTPIDRALVHALGKRVLDKRGETLVSILNPDRLKQAQQGDATWWTEVYAPLPSERSEFRPLDDFAKQGHRLHQDITAISHTYGLSRIERVAFVERILAYHFSLYLVRLTSVLYRELKWAHSLLWPNASKQPWEELNLTVRFHERRAQVPRQYFSEYSKLMEQLNEAYILLPVLNNVELAIRAVASLSPASEPARINDCCWVEAKEELASFSPEKRQLTREVIAFLAEMARFHVGLNNEPSTALRLTEAPMEVLFDAVRLHYTAPDQQRYPKNHHQTVFDSIAGGGPTSFVQKQPFKHFVLGDELIYLLVLSLFEQKADEDRQDTTFLPREPNAIRRRRLPLRDFENRLEEDLLVPADDAARRDLRRSLARLGLIDRLSDVGEGNFLRHPTGI